MYICVCVRACVYICTRFTPVQDSYGQCAERTSRAPACSFELAAAVETDAEGQGQNGLIRKQTQSWM